MKLLKKFTAVIFAALMVTATLAFAACNSGSSSSGGGSKTAASDVDIQNFQYGFMKAEDYDDTTTTVADTHKYTSLDAGTDYYLIVEFEIASRQDNNGTSLLTVDIELDDIDIMTGTIAEANGVSVPMEFVDANTGKNVLTYTTDFKIPDQASVPKPVYIIMELVPVTTGQSHVYLKFSADDFNIYGSSDGLTKDLTINSVQLTAPTLTYLENTGTLVWDQIKYADYYLIYVDDVLLTDGSGDTVIVEADSSVAVGSEMTFPNLDSYKSGYHNVRIRACSYQPIFEDSNYSNLVEVEL